MGCVSYILTAPTTKLFPKPFSCVTIFPVDNMRNSPCCNFLLILIMTRDVFCGNVLEDELNIGYNSIIFITLGRLFIRGKMPCFFTHQSQPLYHPESNESGDARSRSYRGQHGKNRSDPKADPEYASPAKPLT